MNEKQITFSDSARWNTDTIKTTRTCLVMTLTRLYQDFNFDGKYANVEIQRPPLVIQRKNYPMRYSQDDMKIYLSADLSYRLLNGTRDLSVALALSYYAAFGAAMHVCVQRNNSNYYNVKHPDPTQDESMINICREAAQSLIQELYHKKIVTRVTT